MERRMIEPPRAVQRIHGAANTRRLPVVPSEALNGDHAADDTGSMRALFALSRPLPEAEPLSLVGTQAPASHRRQARAADVAREHGGRLASFSAIGALVFALGLTVQWYLVRLGTGPYGSYAGQAILSIELSFVLNRYITWRGRDAPFLASCLRFNAQKLLMTVPNLALYAALVQLGSGWLLANLTTTAVFTVLNYVGADVWSFARRRGDHRGSSAAVIPEPPFTLPYPAPTVSVIVPCRGNERTIRQTVAALLGQDYPALIEVILVGSIADSTWIALQDIVDPRLAIIEQPRVSGLRDPAVKRHTGICESRGELLALADSDIVMDPDWLCRAVSQLIAMGGGVVAGGMRSIDQSFWGRFVDRNVLAAKTPRVPEPYVVTAENFGRRGRKPPITANAVFSRDVYEHCPFDVAWSYGYEDYEWFWRIAKTGHQILFDSDITGAHHHRRSIRALLREYLRSADGCARFVRAHPDSPLSQRRRRQALLLPAGLALCLAATPLLILNGQMAPVAVFVAFATLAVVIREVLASRRLEGIVYPFAGLVLGLAFTGGLVKGMLRSYDSPAPVPGAEPRRAEPGEAEARRPWAGYVIATAIALGAVLRFWLLSAKPAWQVDEVTYTSLGRNLLEHGTLNTPIAYSQAWSPFLFHPPFYFLLLARWFAIVGPSVYHARLLGVLASTATLSLLAVLLWRLHGPVTTLWVITLVTFDGWLLYAQRISYIENLEMVLIVATLVVYRRALARPSYSMFFLTGFLAGFAAIFNHTAAYIVLALVINWAIVHREHRRHLAMMGIAFLVIVGYVAAMIQLFDVGTHRWYIQQTLVQFDRVLGLQHSKGTLTSPLLFLHLITNQYALFVPSLVAALAAVALLIIRLWQCLRRRSWGPLGEDTVLPAWSLAGIIVFGASALRYSQYFSLALIPLYCYLWTRVIPSVRRSKIHPAMAATAAGLVIAVNLGSFALRVIRPSDNAFAQALHYAQHHIPRSATVVAESSIAYEIPQRWCSPYGTGLTSACQRSASYIITWQTFLQSDNPFNSEVLAKMLKHSVPVARFAGWNGTVVVRRVQ
jgi:succinoglycan biosynthesis protein ExoA